MHTRPADAADENETAGQEGYSETFHTFTSMNKELERYIEREIIPRRRAPHGPRPDGHCAEP